MKSPQWQFILEVCNYHINLFSFDFIHYISICWTKHLSGIAGDNLILGSQESKMVWFDMDLSTKPYKSFK